MGDHMAHIFKFTSTIPLIADEGEPYIGGTPAINDYVGWKVFYLQAQASEEERASFTRSQARAKRPRLWDDIDETSSNRVSVLEGFASLFPVNLNDIVTGFSILVSESTLHDLAVQTLRLVVVFA
jgi:hypothetical protein